MITKCSSRLFYSVLLVLITLGVFFTDTNAQKLEPICRADLGYGKECKAFEDFNFFERQSAGLASFARVLEVNNANELAASHLFNKKILPLPLSISEKSDTKNSSVNWTTFTVTSAALAGMYTGLYTYGEQTRWDAPMVPFYFRNDFSPQGIDKLGHFYATKTQAFILSNLYGLSGLSRKKTSLLGAGLAFSVQSLIEIKDGTISGGGFDTFDEIANTLGAGWFYARERVGFLQRFNVRWFYYPSENRDLLTDNLQFNEDYNGHTYWLSMRIWDLLPKSAQPYWPRFIVPAAGISLNDWSVDPSQNGELSYHLSLNFDFKYIIPQRTEFGRTISQFLNGFYIPAPALEVYPNTGVKLIFFGQR